MHSQQWFDFYVKQSKHLIIAALRKKVKIKASELRALSVDKLKQLCIDNEIIEKKVTNRDEYSVSL
jgi:hypothetical protein